MRGPGGSIRTSRGKCPARPRTPAWALDVTGAPGGAGILDAGCGPGADLLTFSELRPRARLTGIEAHASFAEAARARLGSGVEVRVGDMRDARGPWDLIWCAGALCPVGIEAGLAVLRRALAPGGAVVLTEPSTAPDAAPGPAWILAGYAATGEAGIAARVREAGWRAIGARRVGPAAWAPYLGPLEARIATLRPGADAALTAVPDAAEREAALWRAEPGGIGRARLAARPA